MTRKKELLVVWAICVTLLASMGYTIRRNYGESLHDIVLLPSVVTITANMGGAPDLIAEYTISSPTRSNYPIDCQDTGGCDLFVGETFGTDVPKDGRIYTFTNRSANAVLIRDAAGILELAGNVTLGQYDSLTCKYDSDRLVEMSRANN